ncbi:MAG: PEP-CTERM sorting domain-containing protein, partial [Phycisphaerae bacterium]|nr:PEP-CTERM sorting domain-containing protein [Phycisphaerae bacterium]
WTSAGGMVPLGDLSGGSFFSRANGLASDGSVVVGYSISASGTEAFRWTEAGGIVGLGDLTGGWFFSDAQDISADGTVVVGNSEAASGLTAFIWDQVRGIRNLGDVLVNVGLDLTGWTLGSVGESHPTDTSSSAMGPTPPAIMRPGLRLSPDPAMPTATGR